VSRCSPFGLPYRILQPLRLCRRYETLFNHKVLQHNGTGLSLLLCLLDAPLDFLTRAKSLLKGHLAEYSVIIGCIVCHLPLEFARSLAFGWASLFFPALYYYLYRTIVKTKFPLLLAIKLKSAFLPLQFNLYPPQADFSAIDLPANPAKLLTFSVAALTLTEPKGGNRGI
jgi:hypothetical protein